MLDRSTSPRLTTRRQFTREAALALLSTVTITVAESCGGSSSTPSAPTPNPGDLVGAISGNHGHSAIVTAAQVTAGNAFTLDIRGQATHPHSVTLTQADLTSLQNKQQVVKQSTNNDAHTHTVTFTP